MTDFFRRGVADEEARKFDPYAHAVTVIAENHRLIHDGMFFYSEHRESVLANGANLDVLLAVPAATFPHLQVLEVTTDGGPMAFSLYEGTTTSADGTGVSVFNRNRNSALTNDTVVTHTPTITGVGTALETHPIPEIGNKVGIFDETIKGEWNLQPSTKYLLRVNNASGSNRDVQLRIGFYELKY